MLYNKYNVSPALAYQMENVLKQIHSTIFLFRLLQFSLCMELWDTDRRYWMNLYDYCALFRSNVVLTSKTLPVPCSCFMAVCRSDSFTYGNSSTPLWMRKHLKPATPAWIMGRISICKQTSFICEQCWYNLSQCTVDLTLPRFLESHLPRKQYPHNIFLLPPAASH